MRLDDDSRPRSAKRRYPSIPRIGDLLPKAGRRAIPKPPDLRRRGLATAARENPAAVRRGMRLIEDRRRSGRRERKLAVRDRVQAENTLLKRKRQKENARIERDWRGGEFTIPDKGRRRVPRPPLRKRRP